MHGLLEYSGSPNTEGDGVDVVGGAVFEDDGVPGTGLDRRGEEGSEHQMLPRRGWRIDADRVRLGTAHLSRRP